MHVGVKEAISQRVTQKILNHLAPEVLQIDIRGFELGAIIQRNSVDPFHRQHMMAGSVPIDARHAKLQIVAGVLRHLGQRRRLESQIHFHRHRTRKRLDDFDRA